MRTGLISSDDLLLSPTSASPVPETPLPSVPAATHQPNSKTSSVVGMMPMQPMPANMMSPDAMLRAYAESRAAVASPPLRLRNPRPSSTSTITAAACELFTPLPHPRRNPRARASHRPSTASTTMRTRTRALLRKLPSTRSRPCPLASPYVLVYYSTVLPHSAFPCSRYLHGRLL